LGLNKDATDDDIKRAFKKLALKYHPDKNGGDETMFKQINNSYQILKNPTSRKAYDAQNNLPEALNNIFNIFLNVFWEKVKTKKPTIIPIYIDLEDLYYGKLKKLVIKIYDKSIGQSKPFLISLLNYQNQYTFPGKGDYGSDLILELKINPHKSGIQIDTILDKYDLFIDHNITLYEYYYGCNFELKHVSGEILSIHKTFHNKNSDAINGATCGYPKAASLFSIFENKGLPKYENNKLSRGKLYIFFNLILKKHEEINLIYLKDILNENFN
jgi:DnaJ-class molecular chaperone